MRMCIALSGSADDAFVSVPSAIRTVVGTPGCRRLTESAGKIPPTLRRRWEPAWFSAFCSSLHSVGTKVGTPIPRRRAIVGVATTGYVRNEGEFIRHNMERPLVLIGFLIGIELLYCERYINHRKCFTVWPWEEAG